MPPTSRWGITVPLNGLPLPAQRNLVAELPGLGYTDAWSSEVNGTDAFTPLALAAGWAPELRLGTAIAGIYTRGPALLAMNAATVAALAPGRFVLGIGVSSGRGDRVERRPAGPALPAGPGYAAVPPPGAGRGEGQHDRRHVHRDRLPAGQPADPPPALALAALRPQMVALAAELADGAITNWLAPSDVPMVRAVAGPGCELIARIFVCPTADADAARQIGRRPIAAYLTVPAYAAFHDWLGRGERLRAMQQAWAAGDRKGALAAIDDKLVDELAVHGPPARCRERVAEYQASGLDRPVIAIVPGPGVDEADAIHRLGPA